jgi:hypothetical protein
MSGRRKQDKPMRKPNTLENLLFGCTMRELPTLIPGVILVVALVALSILLTNLLNSMLGFYFSRDNTGYSTAQSHTRTWHMYTGNRIQCEETTAAGDHSHGDPPEHL